ncbi:MAG: winged helix-turn-helix domain-containing protein [Nanoarchaeota archaeon]
MAKKRERLEVVNDILVAIRNSKNGLGPTRLLYASNLSPQMFRDYIEELVDSGLIEEQEEEKRKKDKRARKIYVLKEDGYRFLERYEIFSSFVDSIGL